MFGNYYGIMDEHPITKDFVKDMRSLVREAKANKIRCSFTHDDNDFCLRFTGGDEEPLDFRVNNHSGIGRPLSAGLRTHPCDNNFDSAVKVGLMVCLKHGLIYHWVTDSSHLGEEWLLAKKIAEKIGIDTEQFKPLDEFGRNGFIGDL
ncbi:MAG: hypothetical protein IKT27_04535 [Clostridia bacterium]|nr:hypothetical protein [Clostridia bacterium]